MLISHTLFFNDTAPTEIYTLSLHDALPISADPKLKGAPSGHTLPIRELRILAGARLIVTLAGDIITLPGLPSNPNAWDIDLNSDGEITGILST